VIRRLVICTLLASGVVLLAIQPDIASAAGATSPTSFPTRSAQLEATAGTKQTWSEQLTPKKLRTPGEMAGISCSESTSCVAVGEDTFVSNVEVPMAESWNGESWSVNATPTVLINNENSAANFAFTSVSCTSATACEAVGWSGYGFGDSQPAYSLAASWNGTSWALQQVPNAGDPADGENELTSVSCVTSALCSAVGWDVNPEGGSPDPATVAELWNGTTWTIEPTPTFTGTSQLNGVSCITATDCVAVGSQNGLALAEIWNGAAWAVQTTPDPSGASSSSLSNVSCSGAGSCDTVGSYSTATTTSSFAENWNGTSWTLESTPEPAGTSSSSFSSVSCAGTGTCTAVGEYASGTGDLTLAETWDGTTWSLDPTPDPSVSQSSSLDGVACMSGGGCQAVGTATDDGVNDPIAESSTGTNWTAGDVRDPGFDSQSLAGIACESATDCQSVGSYPGQNLAEGWNGAEWNVETTPLEWAGGAVEVPSALYSVACPSSSMCVAAGQTWTDSPETGLEGEFPDVSTWNGSSWVNQQLQYQEVGTLTGVSCSTTAACVAVGFSPQLAGAMIETFNGSKWKAQTPAVPKDGSMVDLESVSCLSAGTCTAVGSYTTASGASATLVEIRNGKNWVVQPNAAPSGATSSTLNGVSCTSSSACTAVGAYTVSGGVASALVESWNGTSWTIQKTPKGGPNSLNGVSCTSRSACTAVGSDRGSASLIDSWNGSSWKAQSASLPYGATSEVLNGVSCWKTANGPQCSAVGSLTDAEGIEETLAVSTSGGSPFVKQQPWNEFVDAGGIASFKALGDGYPVPTVQWHVSTDDGGTWTPLSDGAQPDGSVVSGAGTDALSISDVQSDQNGNEYEAVLSNSIGSVASGAASLSVQDPPMRDRVPSSVGVAAQASSLS
jgi:hypothetical protein